eukprot:CAMPEP_0170509400 /NCGR_PEP_ID=MMETSP0208-20121228/65196_1 /TAXON_ID=197538 /ORGANISM="Strombidium inclinatum, Strain S3" /LENGTH=52 /DNA_ID=CAMNT_0010792759 /DNA_START=499 /DNA_END=657 /DNA_ORIENTATION=+
MGVISPSKEGPIEEEEQADASSSDDYGSEEEEAAIQEFISANVTHLIGEFNS